MTLKKLDISFEETRSFSGIFLDYVNGNEQLRPFYQYKPDLSSFKAAIDDRSKLATDRKVLVDVLLEQYRDKVKQPLGSISKIEGNIELLKHDNTFTVCTGHQLCLFTGPLYFLFKIISTINLAERLKKEYPSNNFVPIYWMASEDHDFEEISSVNLFGRQLKWETEAGGAVGRMNTASIAPIIDELKLTFGESEHARALIELFTKAYLKHNTLADATRYMVNELFADEGVVIIDPDHSKLKGLFSENFRDDILNQTNYKLVKSSIEKLKAIGYEAQVSPREINVFKLGNGDRTRIEESSKEILSLDPVYFSPNVVMRPLYQQVVLPNIAYVGGPGEIAYWLEYKAMFDHHKIQMPVLMPRNFAMLLDEKSSQILEKLNLQKKDLFADVDQLIRDYVSKNASGDISLKEQEEKLKSMFGELANKVGAVDSTLKANVEAEAQKALASLKNIESKLIRSEKQKQETNVNQIKRLKEKFLPNGTLQERHDNFSPFYLRSGNHFIKDLKDVFDPFEFRMLILE